MVWFGMIKKQITNKMIFKEGTRGGLVVIHTSVSFGWNI